MAIRIRNSFHAAGRARTPVELASVVVMLSWKLAQASIQRMRAAGFDIDVGRAYFDFVCEHLAFLAHIADRIAYRELDLEARDAFTRSLVAQLAQVVEDNGEMLMTTPAAGWCREHFLELFNRSGEDYAGFEYRSEGGSNGPDFAFGRCFASRIREAVPEKDRGWVADQVMAIEVPEAVSMLERTLAGLFHPEPETGSRRRRKPVVGD